MVLTTGRTHRVDSSAPMAEFVHLHAHSEYSLLDGANRLEDMVRRTRDLGMRAIALTDHGHLFAAIEFHQTALANGVKPILGMEAYVAPRGRTEKKDVRGVKEANYHLTLLCRNDKGYANLKRLSSIAYQEGFYYKPRIDKQLLAQHHEGLIALSGCPNSEFGHAARAGDLEKAVRIADEYRSILGPENFYLEVQNHGLTDLEAPIREAAHKVARELSLKVVATNDAHYLVKDDAKAHDVLLAIATGSNVNDPERLRYDAPEFYIKSPDEMAALFADHPETLRHSLEIAERCNLEMRYGDIHIPVFELPPGETSYTEYVRKLCFEGAAKRYGEVTDGVRARLDYEISVIDKLGFSSYFLIVWDLRRYAIENGVRVGPGRGSAAGSLVGYCLGITNIDPLRYDLIFERFLNPSRKEMPDIDLDFSNEDRQKVIEYIRTKYHPENVAQIITYGTMKSRLVLRDVGRALGADLKTIDILAKKIPKVIDISLEDAHKQEPEIGKMLSEHPVLRDVWEVALKLEGLSRHAGTHASGVVISDKPVMEHVPLYVADGVVMTQYDMNALTKLGMLKIDVLGLETLTVLDRAVKLVERVKGVKVALDRIPLDDRKTFEMLGRGSVKGVFQMETSRGMRELVQQMKPDRIDEVIATIALFRPGPLGSGMVESYVRRKHGQEKIEYDHPLLEPILRETYGVILYQEQVMRTANVVAGLSMADADALRKAMGKKKAEILQPFRDPFIAGAKKNGVSEEVARKIFDQMAYFAGYGFNKSHSAAYGIVSYQTAYLKANFPVEYMTALMSCAMGNQDKMAEYVEECRQLGIEVLPPDVNASDIDFIVDSGKIRFGLGAVKGVSEKAIQHVIEARNRIGRFNSLYVFSEALPGLVDQKTVEALVRCGAFDSTGLKRAQLMEVLEPALRIGTLKKEDKSSGQLTFFAASMSASEYPPVPDVPEWPQDQLLAFEREALGVYVTSNPLVRYEEEIRTYSTTSVDRLGDLEDGADVTIGGMISGIKTMITKTGPNKGNRYKIMKFSDLTGVCEAAVFTKDLERTNEQLLDNALVFVTARVGFRNETPGLRVSDVVPIHQAREQLTGRLIISLAGVLESAVLERVKEILGAHPGQVPVFFEVPVSDGHRVVVAAPNDRFVSASEAFLSDVNEALGPGRVRFAGKPRDPNPRPQFTRRS